MNAQSFHRFCDDKTNLLTVIKATTGRVFGAYQGAHLPKDGCNWITDPTAFLFSLSDCKKLPMINGKMNNAIYNHKNNGPRFGNDI